MVPTTVVRFILICTAALATTLAGSAVAEKPITVGHLTHHTGQYGGFGEFFDGITDFTLNVINESPPMGRPLAAIHEDIGTIGEARGVRRLLNVEKIDILLNSSHGYDQYREMLLKRIRYMKKPLLPSVHGGSIDPALGGVGTEPLFRGGPMDTAQSVAAMLHLSESGKRRIVLVSTTLKGHEQQRDASIQAAEKLGLTVAGIVSIQPTWTDYTSVVKRVDRMKPDAVVVLSAPQNGGLFVRNAAEAGFSWTIVGTTEWQEYDFVQTAGEEALAFHESVVLSAYAYAESPAWEFYRKAVAASPQADAIGDAANSYAMQYYDLLVLTALALEKAGSVNSENWSKAMHAVSGGSGKLVHTYAEGIAALRSGKEINYDGVTGSMEYSDTGVVSGLFGIFSWSGGQLQRISIADGDRVAELDQ
ncbi:MAG: ABC transporter substrate-binding protein [Granulosicoccus sp.]|nr:ABC transporter substrate-binding protein [Granulosicoccus sp.]